MKPVFSPPAASIPEHPSVTTEPANPPGTDARLDIFADTIAEMTWYQVEEAARSGAILLWAFGVIEQHGPHMPTGTDVYLPSAHLRNVRARLAARGIQALIVPPYYWGVNDVSGSFPASYQVRPEIMIELLSDIFGSLARDGFKHVFCVSGHGDRRHNFTLYQAIQAGRARTELDISFVLEPALALRLELTLDDPALTLQRAAGPRFIAEAAGSAAAQDASTAPRYIDVHAGCEETSMMMCSCPELVRNEIRQTLQSTDYGPEDLAVWRRGFAAARMKTPLGYFGDPAAASRAYGEALFASHAERAAEAIAQRLAK